jgi:hypothetical protein
VLTHVRQRREPARPFASARPVSVDRLHELDARQGRRSCGPTCTTTLTHTVAGRKMSSGDDDMMTRYALLEGKAVIQIEM